MSKPLKLLYVDDEADIRMIVELGLKMDPAIDAIITATGEDALAQLGKDGWMPDLALFDVMMPGMSGMDLLHALRARDDTARIPVLFVTASARSAELERYTQAGAIGVISKPFDPVALPRLVRRYYDEWLAGSG